MFQGVKPSERKTQVLVGAKIKAARQAADLTQEAVATRTGIELRRYRRIEQGVMNPTVRTLLRIAEALGLDFWLLLSHDARGRHE